MEDKIVYTTFYDSKTSSLTILLMKREWAKKNKYALTYLNLIFESVYFNCSLLLHQTCAFVQATLLWLIQFALQIKADDGNAWICSFEIALWHKNA